MHNSWVNVNMHNDPREQTEHVNFTWWTETFLVCAQRTQEICRNSGQWELARERRSLPILLESYGTKERELWKWPRDLCKQQHLEGGKTWQGRGTSRNSLAWAMAWQRSWELAEGAVGKMTETGWWQLDFRLMSFICHSLYSPAILYTFGWLELVFDKHWSHNQRYNYLHVFRWNHMFCPQESQWASKIRSTGSLPLVNASLSTQAGPQG